MIGTSSTVYCLDQLDVPIIVGIGDIGKMNRKDDVEKGSPITMKAVELILERRVTVHSFDIELFDPVFIDAEFRQFTFRID